MRVIRVVLIALALLLLLMVIAVVALVSPAGQRTVQNAFDSWATERLGRSASIDGVLTLQLGRDIVIDATNVHLANVEWGSRADMLVADRVTIKIDALSLLSRSPTLIVDEVGVDGLDLLLERNEDGANNWAFPQRPERSESHWLSALPVVVDRVSLPGARLRFIGPRLDRPLDISFEQITQQRGAGDMLEFAATGRANDADLSVTGQIGPFANLVAGKAISTSIDGHLGQMNWAIRARIDNIARPVDSEVDVEVRGPDAAYVATTFGVRDLGDGPFNFTLSVSPAPDGHGVRGSVIGQIGRFDISGDGELSEPTQMGKLTLRTEISGPDVSLLAGLAGFDRLPPEQFHLVATIRRTGSLLEIDQANLELPDSAFSVQGSVKRIDKLSGNDLTAHFEGAKVEKFRKLLSIPGIATGPFDVNVRLHSSDAGQELMDLTSRTAVLDLTASGPLGPYPDYYGTRLRFSASGGDFTPWAETVGLVAARVPFSSKGELEWTRGGVQLRAATLSVADDTLNLDGVISPTPHVAGDVRFGLQGKRLSDVAAYVGWSDFPAAPYKAAGHVVLQNGRARLDGIDLSAAGARLQFSGTLGAAPQWRGTAMTFTLSGADPTPFKPLAGGYGLPAGPFKAQGAFQYADGRVRLQNVSIAAAGSNALVTTDFALPLGATVGDQPNRINVSANGPDLRLLVPDMPDASVVRQKFDLTIDASWKYDKWTFDTFHFDSPGGFLSLQGRLDRAPDFSATALTVKARTSDLETTGRLFGLHLPDQPLDLTAVITGTPTTFRMDGLSGHFGKTDFAGTIGLDLTSKPDLDIQLTSNFLDLTPLTDAVGETPTATVPLDSKSIPNVTLPLDLLNEVNAQASIQSAKTSFVGQTYDHLELRGTLRDGQLTVDPLAFGSTAGNLTSRIAIGPDLSAPNVRLSANGDEIRLAVIPGLNVTAAASLYKVQIDVAATGRNLRDLAATLDGRIRLEGTGGRVPNSRMNQALTSDFLGELARTLNPLSKRQEYTDVVCQAYLFEVERGTLRTDPVIVIRTKELDIISTGSVDLSNEKIDFNFKTAARGGLGFSAGELLNSYVKVSGTLSKPYLTVDPKGTLVYGGAAFATGGLSILATTVWDRVTRQKDPCAAALAEADQRSAAKKRWW